MLVTPLYAALLAGLFFALSVRTLRLRRGLRIPLGDAGDDRMLRAIRAHGNFAEYAPLTLVLLLMLELQDANAVFVHALCISLVVGRVVHAVGVSRSPENFRLRVAGMSLTFTALIGGAAGLLALPLLR